MNEEVQFHQVDNNGNESSITISYFNGRYIGKSSSNMILCADCGKLISIHSNLCVTCGCPMMHTLKNYFDEQVELKKIQEQELEQAKERKRVLEKEKSDIRSKIIALIGLDKFNEHIDDSMPLEDLKEIYEIFLKEKEQESKRVQMIYELHNNYGEYFANKNIDLTLLKTNKIKEFHSNIFGINEYVGEDYEKQAPQVFLKTLNSITVDVNTIKTLWRSYKYQIILKKKGEYCRPFEIITKDGAKKVINTNFILKLKEHFSIRMEEYRLKAMDGDKRILDKVALEKYFVYTFLAGQTVPKYLVQKSKAIRIIDEYNPIESDLEFGIQRFRDYLSIEVSNLYHELFLQIRKNYYDLRWKEEAEYKKSESYKKLKRKEYYSRPKEERDREELKLELAKLDYWIPNIAPSDTHISYTEKVFDDSTTSENYFKEAIGFVASIEIEEYFEKMVLEYKKRFRDDFITLVLNSISIRDEEWQKSEDFDLYCKEHYYKEFFDMSAHLQEVNELLILVGARKEETPQPKGLEWLEDRENPGKYLYQTEINTVVDYSKVEVCCLESKKIETLYICNRKRKYQKYILGRKVGETYFFPSSKNHYRITKILY